MRGLSKLLASGRLGAAAVTLYTCPTGKVARITRVTYANNQNTGYDVHLIMSPYGQSSLYLSGAGQALAAKTKQDFPGDDSGYDLVAGDVLRGYASTTQVVDFAVWGVEQSYSTVG